MRYCLAAFLASILFLSGCAKKEKVVFAFVPKLLDNSVFQLAWQGAQAAAKDFRRGRMMAEYLVKGMGTKGNVAILMGTPGAPNLEERKQGILDALRAYPEVKVVATEFCYDDVNKGVSVMEAAMQAHPDLTGWVLPGAWALFTPPPGPFGSKKPGELTVIAIDALPEE